MLRRCDRCSLLLRWDAFAIVVSSLRTPTPNRKKWFFTMTPAGAFGALRRLNLLPSVAVGSNKQPLARARDGNLFAITSDAHRCLQGLRRAGKTARPVSAAAIVAKIRQPNTSALCLLQVAWRFASGLPAHRPPSRGSTGVKATWESGQSAPTASS